MSPIFVELSTDVINLFSTWFGGHEDESFPEISCRIAINPVSNQIGMVGQTTAVDFPLTDGANLKEKPGELSGFLVVLSE